MMPETQCYHAVPCKERSKIYLGETGRNLAKEMKNKNKNCEHIRDVRYTWKSNAYFIQVRDEGHQLN